MASFTKQQVILSLRSRAKKIAKERDALRDVVGEVEDLFDHSDEAVRELEDCIDRPTERAAVIRFGAIDLSMRNCGLVFGTYNLGDSTYNVGEGHLIQTFPDKDKKVRASAKDYAACRSMYIKLHNYLEHFQPQIMFAEMPTGSQSANGMKSYGISLALLGTISCPVIQVSPQEVKVASVDSKTASKDTMIRWAVKRWPDIQWLTRKIKGEIELLNKNEHIADACGAVEAGMRTDQWQQLLSVLKGQQPATPVEEDLL